MTEPKILPLPGPALTLSETDVVRSRILSEFSSGNYRVVLDMGAVKMVDSSWLALIVGLLKKASQQQGDIKLANVQPMVRKVIELMRLHKVFDIHDSTDAAVAAFH